MKQPPVHIVLVEPEIPANTGSIGRTCVAIGAPLHLVGQLGFSLEDKYLKRAGLDYWKDVQLHQHRDWPAFKSHCFSDSPPGRRVLFSKKAQTSFWDFKFQPDDWLIFGKETRGLSSEILQEDSPLLKIPTPGPVRSLNLSVAVGVAVYEALRQIQKN